MNPTRLALVGDYSPQVIAHGAIEQSLQALAAAGGAQLVWNWLATEAIVDAPRQLAVYDGVWCVPGSPYRNMEGALAAIRFAREAGRAFLGTCGGFQHALIEIARHELGIAAAEHAETSTGTGELVVTPLSCSLVGARGRITYTPGSMLARIIGASSEEGYHCSYGPNPAYRARFEAAGLKFTAFDEGGEIRGLELPSPPFFAGTLFQPERAVLAGPVHPLVSAFAATARKHAATRSPTSRPA